HRLFQRGFDAPHVGERIVVGHTNARAPRNKTAAIAAVTTSALIRLGGSGGGDPVTPANAGWNMPISRPSHRLISSPPGTGVRELAGSLRRSLPASAPAGRRCRVRGRPEARRSGLDPRSSSDGSTGGASTVRTDTET